MSGRNDERMGTLAVIEQAAERKLTPLQAIRKYCVDDCCVGQAKEVRLCPSVSCPLYPYRFGRKPKNFNPEFTSLKAIRARCLDCVCGAKQVRECWDTNCSLYAFRLGKNPNRKGIGGRFTIAIESEKPQLTALF